jgi:hypothetical protein
MGLKGFKLHRADGTIDTYNFPSPQYIVNPDDENIGNGNSDVTGDAGTTGKLFVYRSGDADFVNCDYSSGSNIKMKKPPFTVDGEEITDHIRATYYSSDSSPSSYAYLNLALNTTFAEYSKLYIEACYIPFMFGNDYYQCGFYNNDVDHDDGDIFYDTGYEGQTMSEERKIYEFDISECVVSRTVSFLMVTSSPLCIYNIWLEQ